MALTSIRTRGNEAAPRTSTLNAAVVKPVTPIPSTTVSPFVATPPAPQLPPPPPPTNPWGPPTVQPPPPPSVQTPPHITGGNAPTSYNFGPITTKPNSASVITGTANTGGNAPVSSTPIGVPMPKPTVNFTPTGPVTGGNAPVSTTPTQPTVTPPTGPVTGGNAPVSTTPFPTTTPPPVAAYPAGMDAGSIVSDFMTNLLNEDGAYIENARRRGIETAQNRGLRNSSIASGASQRAAIEAAQPLVNEMVGIHQNRENRAFTGEQNQLDRNQQLTMSQVQNWLNDQSFQREFNGALAMLPITSSANLMQVIQQYALENPEVYTPDVINGFANFFQNNFATMLADYFPQYYGGGGG